MVPFGRHAPCSRDAGSARLPARFGGSTSHRLLSSSFLGLPSRFLNINYKKELLTVRGSSLGGCGPRSVLGFRVSGY